MVTSAICVHRYLAEHAIDIVHTFDVPANLLGVPISAASRTPVVISSQRPTDLKVSVITCCHHRSDGGWHRRERTRH